MAFLDQIPTLSQVPEAPNEEELATGAMYDNSQRHFPVASTRKESITTGQYIRTSVGGRRTSITNTRRGRTFGGSSSAQPPTEAEMLMEISGKDPQKAPKPRFTSSLSLEAQYAILKGYEDKLRMQIESCYPEFTNVLLSSPSPPADFKGKSVTLRDLGLQSASAIEVSHKLAVDDTQDSSRKRGKSVTTSHSRFDLPEAKQLELSRRYQFAQYLSDYFVYRTGQPTLNQKLLQEQKDFNPVNKFNWWSGWWANEFKFEDCNE